MHKTSVYLTPEEIELLRRTAARTGRSRAQLIRDGVRLVTGEAESRERAFHSLAQGHGGGTPYRGWDADELYRSVAPSR